jgi:hypothetical protein
MNKNKTSKISKCPNSNNKIFLKRQSNKKAHYLVKIIYHEIKIG